MIDSDFSSKDEIKDRNVYVYIQIISSSFIEFWRSYINSYIKIAALTWHSFVSLACKFYIWAILDGGWDFHFYDLSLLF